MSQQHAFTLTRLGSEQDPVAIANDVALQRVEAEIKPLWRDPGDHDEFCHKVAKELESFHQSVQVHPSEYVYYYLHVASCSNVKMCDRVTTITVGDPYKMPMQIRITSSQPF